MPELALRYVERHPPAGKFESAGRGVSARVRER